MHVFSTTSEGRISERAELQFKYTEIYYLGKSLHIVSSALSA